VAITVVAPPAAADVPALGDDDDGELAAGVVADGELAADDELDEQAASRLMAAAGASMAYRAVR
jgi:hypothetical protein